jgi:uncharacterized membrane protein YhaH (DUF805 family)
MEYWMFVLLTVIVYAILGGLMFAGGFDVDSLENEVIPEQPGVVFWLGAGLLGIFALGILVPSIAVNVRRLHDRDMSGWWYLGFIVLSNIPLLGILIALGYLVLMFLPGTPGPNRFGEDPKDPTQASVFE